MTGMIAPRLRAEAAATDLVSLLVASEGSGAAAWPRSPLLLKGPNATRNLADAAHFLCLLHGRHPGILDLAQAGVDEPRAHAWLEDAADRFGAERNYLTRISVAAGPLPSTIGHPECEQAVLGQRAAFETLARSERVGCALGAALALALDWQAIHAVLDVAAERFGLTVIAAGLPDQRDTHTVALAVADNPAVERALAFAAQQILTQHRGLWRMLEARAASREDY